MYLFTSCCFIAGHVSASNSFLSVPGISCYGKWWGFLNKAAEKAKCSGLSGEAEGQGRERSVPGGMERHKASQSSRCLHHCSECHLISRWCNPLGIASPAASPPGTAEVSGRSGGDALSQRRHQLMEEIKGLAVILFLFFSSQDNRG